MREMRRESNLITTTIFACPRGTYIGVDLGIATLGLCTTTTSTFTPASAPTPRAIKISILSFQIYHIAPSYLFHIPLNHPHFFSIFSLLLPKTQKARTSALLFQPVFRAADI